MGALHIVSVSVCCFLWSVKGNSHLFPPKPFNSAAVMVAVVMCKCMQNSNNLLINCTQYRFHSSYVYVSGLNCVFSTSDAFFWVGPGDTPSINGYACAYGDNV